MLDTIMSADFIFIVIRVTTPLLFAALSALFAQKAGIVNIGVEGYMLTAALLGVVFSHYTQNVWISVFLTLLVTGLFSLIIAFSIIQFGTDEVLSGLAFNMFASGFTVFTLYQLTGDKGLSASLQSKVMPSINIPIIKDIPVLGTIISGHHILTYVSIISVLLVWFVLYRTKYGVKVRAVGENSKAAESVGINVNRIQYSALLVSSVFAALGGMFMSMGYLSWFSGNMTSGRGFIGLAATTMGQVEPLGVMLSSLLFGLADALSNSILNTNIPSEFLQMIPYIATILGLVLYSVRKNKVERKKN